MNQLELLAAKKQALVELSNEQRNNAARVYYQWQARTSVARNVTGIFRNPIVLAALGFLAIKLPWRKSMKLGGWFWKSWKLLRVVKRFI